ncbi:MAG: type II toxin-antitoxin system HicB family antitoxin [Janthinobacterium lividum]
MRLTIQYDRETDGRWIAEVPQLLGVMVYGDTKDEARTAVVSLAQMVINEKAESERARMDKQFAMA